MSSEQSPKPGTYFTDGRNLLRFEDEMTNGRGVILEDVSSGRVWTVPTDEFKAMELREVEPLKKGVSADR